MQSYLNKDKEMYKIIAVLCATAFFLCGDVYAGKPSSSGGRSYSSSSGKSYSSGSRSSSGSSRSSFGSKSTNTSIGGSSFPSRYSKGKTYSSGSTSSSEKGLSSWFGSKSSSSDFNKSLSQAAKKETSKTNYIAAKESSKPKSSVGDNDASKYSKGKSYASTSNQDNSTKSTSASYRPRYRSNDYENRATIFYGPYYTQPTYYNDSFSPFIMGWLMSDAVSSRSRAEWVYNHQGQIDQARLDDLLRKDAKLQAELDNLKAQQSPVDTSYVPTELQGNEDLMYSKDFLEKTNSSFSLLSALLWIFKILVYGCLIVILSVVIYLLFIKDFK